MKTLNKLVLNGEEYTVQDSKAVSFDREQALSPEEQLQAQENIGISALPKTTVADAGKFLRVGANGRLAFETVVNAEEVAY